MGNLHLVTGYAGAAHVASSDQGSLNEALIRSGQFVLNAGAKFAASIVSNNQVKVNDGELLMQGRHVKLTPGAYVDLAIENGAQGYLRNDLIVARYTKNTDNEIEECNLVVLKGTPSESTPSDPEYSTGNINANGTLQHDFPLYRVTISGLSIETLGPLFEPQKSIYDELLKLNNERKEEHTNHTNNSNNPHNVTAAQVGALPDTTTALKNPKALTFTGGVTGSYDGSEAKSVVIPTALKCPNKLTINGVTYDGSAAKDMTDTINALIATQLGVIENGTY